MPDNEPPPPPAAQQMSQQRDEAMAELGLEPAEIRTDEGEVVVIFMKLQTNEIGVNDV